MPKPRRNIQAAAEETLTPPDALAPGQKIARVHGGAGNNLYTLELPSRETLLAELPAKFRSTIWMKRGSYVVVDTAALAGRGNKLGGEIVNIVGDEKAWRKLPYWPVEFPAKTAAYGRDSDSDGERDDDGPRMPPSDEDDDDE
jgi:probable RNA-binding protein EIF1AD